MNSQLNRRSRPYSEPGDLQVLETHLLRRLSTRVRDLALVARPGGLVLRGRTRTYYEKQLAQHALMEATSTPIMSNEIEVEG